jgi:hypothetical protein
MHRRNAVKNLAMAASGMITLPFWMTACRMSGKNAPQETLRAIVDTIIPAGSQGAVGALSLGVDKFLQKVIDDCYEKPVRDNVQQQLTALEASAQAGYGKSFAACTVQQRQEMIMKGLHASDKAEKECWMLLKNETIRGFNTSQQVMEGFLHYKVAPGHYYGCVDINS